MVRIGLAVVGLLLLCGGALADSDTVRQDLPDGYLNLRSGPGVNHDVLAQVPAGATLEIGQCVLPDDNGQTTSGWCEARWNGTAGFVSDSGLSGDYLNADDLNGWDGSSAFADSASSAAPAPAAQTAQAGDYMVPDDVSGGSVPMRAGPGVTFDEIVDIPAGATGLKIGQCMAPEDNGQSHKDWCIVSWNGHQGFTSSCCIAPDTQPPPAQQQASTGPVQGRPEPGGFQIVEGSGTAFHCDASFRNCGFLQLIPNEGLDTVSSGPGSGEVTWTQKYTLGSNREYDETLRCGTDWTPGSTDQFNYKCRVAITNGTLYVMDDLRFNGGQHSTGVLLIDLKTLACSYSTRWPEQGRETHYEVKCSSGS